MIEGKKVLGIIPARGGSKGLPGKNIKNLLGKPLIGWTIERALESKFLDKVMVTTDSREIQDVSLKYGAEAPFLRPDKLSSDTATSVDVVTHVLDYCEEQGEFFDYLVLLEPTSPLREKDDIDLMLEKLISNQSGADSIVSIGQVESHPCILKVKNGEKLEPFDQNLPKELRRQDMEDVYFPYGVAYIIEVSQFRRKKTFYTKNALFYEIKRYQCYEIDDIYDFLAIENIMRFEWNIKN